MASGGWCLGTVIRSINRTNTRAERSNRKHKVTRTTRIPADDTVAFARHINTLERLLSSTFLLAPIFHARLDGCCWWMVVEVVCFGMRIYPFLVPWIVRHLGWRAARHDLLVLGLHSGARRTAGCCCRDALACPGLLQRQRR